MNGWANYETWNASLWIGNEEFLYNTAKACVTYCGENETPWDKFVLCMMDGQIDFSELCDEQTSDSGPCSSLTEGGRG